MVLTMYGKMPQMLLGVLCTMMSGFVYLFLGDKAWYKNMNIGELYIVINAVKMFGKLMSNAKVTLHIDNQVVCHCVNNASSKNDE